MKKTAGKLITMSRWLFTEKPTSAAVDITHRCNLKCSHCYWWKQAHPRELGDEEMIAFMNSLRAKGLRVAILYGGEPTMRLEICREAGRIFDSVLVFTNGTNGYPHLPNGQWVLSLDGPRDINDSLRGKGVYSRAVEELPKASRPPIVHMTISRLNMNGVSAFVEEMTKLPIKGIGFSFYTPQKGSADRELFIPLKERDRVVTELLELRKRFGIRVGFTPAMARQLLSKGDYFSWNRFELCPVSRRVECYRADGRIKVCTYGDDADCSRCGCAAVAAYRGAFRPFHLQTLLVIMGLMMPGLDVPVRRRKKGTTNEHK
ncbi:radical SAM protein [Thermodesulfobacteriota bacterium]